MSHSTFNSKEPQQGSWDSRSVVGAPHHDHASSVSAGHEPHANVNPSGPHEHRAPTPQRRPEYPPSAPYHGDDQPRQPQPVRPGRSNPQAAGHGNTPLPNAPGDSERFPWTRLDPDPVFPSEFVVDEDEDPNPGTPDGRSTTLYRHGPPAPAHVQAPANGTMTRPSGAGRGTGSRHHHGDGHTAHAVEEHLSVMTEHYLSGDQRDEPFNLVAYPDRQRGRRH